MSLELYKRVALRKDLPQHGLKQGDIATVVDYVPHPSDGSPGYVLEVFNALGESIMTIAVPIESVEPLHEDEILSIRQLVPAS